MPKVLVVDDEPDIVQVVKARLESIGHQVAVAENGKKALEVLNNELPDLIILDVLMPVMDGFQLYKELKQKVSLAKIPVLVLTARGKMEDTFRVIGVDEFISKPFETEDFLRKVNKLLEIKAPISPSLLPVANPVQRDTQILLSGSDQEVISKMVSLLTKAGYSCETAVVGPDIIAKSTSLLPKLILLDVLMMEIQTEEMVKALRSIPALAKISIVLYSFVRAEAGEDVQQKIMSIETAKENCLAAGATGNIGSFNENTFIKVITPFILKVG